LTKFVCVPKFTVIDEHDITESKRLIAARIKVTNRESRMPEPPTLYLDNAFGVWPAVLYTDKRASWRSPNPTDYSAH